MEAVKQKSADTVNRASATPLQVQRSAAAATARASVRVAPRIQASSLRVSSPADSAEKEADSTAKKVVGMSIPDRAIAFVRTAAGGVFRQLKGKDKEHDERERMKQGPAKWQSPQVARFADTGLFRRPLTADEEKLKREGVKQQPLKIARFVTPGILRLARPEVQRKAEGMPNLRANVSAEIQAAKSGGSPLPLSVRRFMEPRFKADFSKVKVHTGDRAAKLSRQVNAKAFAVGGDVFFGKGQYQPETGEGRELIAHELTHTIQQGAAPQALQRSEDTTVTQSSGEQVQRLGLSDALDYFADKANLIPGFRMLTIILGVNPVNMSRVERSAANIMRAIVEFIPGGGLITRALDNYGVFDKVGAWVEEQIASLGMTGSLFKQAIDEFLDSLSWTDIFDLGGVWNRAKRIFTEPVDRLISFAKNLITGILGFIRDAILRPLAGLAQGTRGYDLIKALMGQDPITGDPYPRTAETVIGGFMKFIGQEDVWENIKKGNAIGKAWAWFQESMGGLMAQVRAAPGKFMDAVRSLTLEDIVLLPRAFGKVAGVFLDIIGGFFSWAAGQVMKLLIIVFEVVSPGAAGYIKKTGAALLSILKNPFPFVGNLVKAAKGGFMGFKDRFGTHLKKGLIDWLTGSLPGIYIPRAFSLGELVKFVFSVLGLTWANVRAKLVKAVGETAVKVMETGFDIVKTLITQGPAAAWDKIKEALGSLQDMVVGGITDLVVDAVTKKAIPKLVAMFIPGAGFITAILSIYDTVMVFVNKISKIIEVVTGFVNSIVAIAAGNVTAAAKKVEDVLAGLLTLAINFLAGFAGLGRVSDKIMGVLAKVRAPIDKALDALVNWIVTGARSLLSRALGGDPRANPQQRLDRGMAEAQAAVARYAGRRVAAPVLRVLLAVIRTRHALARLDVVPQGGVWAIEAEVNPRRRQPTPVQRLPDGGEFTMELGRLSAGQVGAPAASGSFSRDRRKEPGYVGTVPALPRNSPAAIAGMYLSQAFRGPDDARRRFALVIGVNAAEDLAGLNRRALEQVGAGGGSGFPVVVFRFMWEPQWKKNGASVTVAAVRAEFAPASGDDGPTRQAKDTIRGLLTGYESSRLREAVPFGPIRQRIHSSPYTSTFADDMQSRNKTVYLHVGDADAVSLRVPEGEGLPLPTGEIVTGILALYDHLLRGYADENVAIASTGYTFRLPETGGPGDANALTNVANALDMRVRSAMARVNPSAVYFPEPNTIIHVSGNGVEGRWGRSQAEMIDMARSLLARQPGAGQIFVTRGPVTTEAGRFTLPGGGRGVATAVVARLGQLTEAEVKQMFKQGQSHANRQAWVAAIMRSDPGRRAVAAAGGGSGGAARVEAVVKAIYDRFFPNAIYGFDPAALGRGLQRYDPSRIQPPRTTTLRDQAQVILDTARAAGNAVAVYLRSILPQSGRRRR